MVFSLRMTIKIDVVWVWEHNWTYFQFRKFTIQLFTSANKRINTHLRTKTHNTRVYFYGLFSKDDSSWLFQPATDNKLVRKITLSWESPNRKVNPHHTCYYRKLRSLKFVESMHGNCINNWLHMIENNRLQKLNYILHEAVQHL